MPPQNVDYKVTAAYDRLYTNLAEITKAKFVLSVDGGEETHGIIPAVFLRELEKKLNARVAKMFEWLVGSSTGAFLTAALSVPDPKNPTTPRYSADDMVKVYKGLKKRIARPSFWHKLKTGFGLFGPKYSGVAKTRFYRKFPRAPIGCKSKGWGIVQWGK